MLFVRVGINGSGYLLSCWGLLLRADVRLVVGLSEGDVVGPGLLRLLSAKRNALGRFPVANAPHYSMCHVFMAVMRILSLHINSDFAQLGVPDLLVHTVSTYTVVCHCHLFKSAHVIAALVSTICYACQQIAYNDSSWNGNVKGATLECMLNFVSIDAKLENLLSVLLILMRN